MPEGYLVADRTYPAYYYPLIWFLNHPQENELALRKVTMRSFWLHLELTEEAGRSGLEKKLSQIVPDDEVIWATLKTSFSSWVKNEKLDEAKVAAIERVLFVGTLAPFYRPEDIS